MKQYSRSFRSLQLELRGQCGAVLWVSYDTLCLFTGPWAAGQDLAFNITRN